MFITGPNLGTSSGACMRVARPARPARSGRFRTGYNYPRCAILQQGMRLKVFSKVYCDRVYFLCAERFVTGPGGGGGALDFQLVGVCRWGVENRTLS